MSSGTNRWFVIRSGSGEVLDSAICIGDEEAQRTRLEGTVAIRETRGFRTARVDKWTYRAEKADEVHLLTIQDGPP
jgi:hypothetical protein